MNLNRLKPSWDQFKAINGLMDIDESEILSCMESQDNSSIKMFSKRVVQNIFVYSMILALGGGCSF
ncbi:hypothetical protein [Aquiflexum sp.]|uniref:hypothetical protein n=1 Tax=Aquiflexum sp. TaxID=1872584 RepID=UPI003593F538